MTEQPEVWTHCFMCGHPVEAHDRNDDGNRPCRSPGHPKGVPCSGCRALLTTEYRERIQDVRELIHYRQTLLGLLTALHSPVEHMGQIWCASCSVRRSTGPHSEEWVAYIPHPCPTLDALETTAPSTAEETSP
jgi:hypothetical protein